MLESGNVTADRTRVLLLYPSQESSDYLLTPRVEYGMKRVPKLGLMYISATLERLGIDGVIRDQAMETYPLDALLSDLGRNRYLFVGIHSATTLSGKVVEYIRSIRRGGFRLPIVVGGPGYHRAADYLEAGADIVCQGEGERTVVQIVEYLSGKRSLDNIKGIAYRKDGRTIEAPPQDLIENLDEIPMPRRERDPWATDYYDYHVFNMRRPYTTMLTSRGCPYVCTFCSSCNIWGHRVRQRSVNNVIAEIDFCVNKLGIRYIGFKDDLFGADPAWTAAFCKALIEQRYPMFWSCMVHPFSFRKDGETILPLMKRAGCDLLSFGLQSAHPKILRNIRRHPAEPAALEQAIRIAKHEGISTVVEVIFGLPGDTPKTIETTIEYLLSVRPHYAQFNTLSVLDGSEMKRQFGDSPVCELSEAESRRWCAVGARRFYSRPGLLMQDLRHVLQKNPRFLLTAMRFPKYIGGYIGFLNRAA